ncbi:unnamed protein product [Miscanthus lutarioriparius]|uniref:Nucleoplasmin-like domain-containing protein n=1 Tax=Miscanthus lutarioriparius TaxID=422564 RepID=A0A811P931_9POAL|nr:unnamed protein product [Miscanthus lutarioriparius]
MAQRSTRTSRLPLSSFPFPLRVATSIRLIAPPTSHKTLFQDQKQRGGAERRKRCPGIGWPCPRSQAMGFEMRQCGATGVVVRPGETVKCDPGGLFCHISQIALQAGKGNEDVRIFMKVDDKEFLIATLSDDKVFCPFNIIFIKNDVSDDESYEEIPLDVPLYPSVDVDKSKEAGSSAEKLAAPPGPAAIQSSTSKETMDPGKLQTDIGSDDDDSDEDYVDSEEGETSDDEDFSDDRRSQDFSDEDASESSNEDDEDSPKCAKDKNRPAEKTLKTPPEKKARMTTPSKGKNTDEKCSGTGMRSGYVHVATPYPSKLVKKTSSIVERPKQPTGYACNSCSSDTGTEEDDKSKDSKCGLEKPTATESSKPTISLEETKDPDKPKADAGGTEDGESDEDC